MTANFRLHMPLTAWKSEDGDPERQMRIGGLVSTDTLDKQGETIVQEGLNFQPFLNEGWYNDNHGQKTTDVLGYPTDARLVRKGDRLPNGAIAPHNGWWAEGYLLNTENGRKTWALCNALSKSPRKLGFSIEGKVGQRDPRNKARIMSAIVKNVAVTHCPVNTGTEMHALVKALTAGSAIENPGAAPGEGFPLRAESLDTTEHKALYGRDTVAPVGSVEDPEFATLAEEDEDGGEPNNGGWGGQNPHKSPLVDPIEALPPRKRAEVVKAEVDRDFPLEPMHEADAVDAWLPHLRQTHKDMTPEGRLTKAEARIIVRSTRPDLSEDAVEQIVSLSHAGVR